MIDYHVHSNISADSKEEMDEICAYAVKAGLQEICFTEHLDIDYPYDDIDFSLDFDLYNQAVKRAREKFKGLTIRQGLEVGLKPDVIERTNALLADRKFDFIIASQHVIGDVDPWYGRYFNGRTKEEGFLLYLAEVFNCLKLYNHYNVVGHLGFPSKFGKFEDNTMQYEDYRESIDRILKHILQEGKGLEVNTASYSITGEDMPSQSILKRYRELKGEIVTIGSDTHIRENVGAGYNRVVEYLKAMGFQYICTFEGMKPSFIKI